MESNSSIKESDKEVPLHPEYWLTKEGYLSFWDDPSVTGGVNFPEHYQPLTHIVPIINKIESGFLDELDLVLLKVIGDAIAPTEEQVKRYLGNRGLTKSNISNRIKRMREHGFLERWHIRSNESDIIYPSLSAPITLGLSGFIIMKHYYRHQFFMNSMLWDRLGIASLQRFMAGNEIRCRLFEAKVMKNWVWNGLVLNNPSIPRPFITAEVETPKGVMKFIFERVHQGKNYLSHLTKRINRWGEVFKEYSTNLPVRNSNDMTTIVIFNVSTRSLAEHITHELALFNQSFRIWLCIEEDMCKFGLENSFYISEKTGLKPVKMSFLAIK